MYLGFTVYYCGTKEYAYGHNFLYRVFYYYVAMTGQRMMYYVPWCFTDAACIACGISYGGQKKDKGKEVEDWTYIYGVDILGIELNYTPLKMMACWNHQIHVWLRNHV